MFRSKSGCRAQPRRCARPALGQGPAAGVLASLALAGTLLLGAAVPVRADAVPSKCDAFVTRALAAKPTSGWSSVIVKLQGGDLTKEREAELKSLGGYVYCRLPLIQSAAVRVPSKNLSHLANLPFVARLSSDVAVKKNDAFTVASSGADVAFGQYNLTGDGVTVAVVDSGVRRHDDLLDPATGSSRILAGVSFVSTSSTGNDLCGHGTHVAGIIAGNGANSTGGPYFRSFYGIARKASIVNVRVLNNYGRGDVSSVVAGIQWVVNNKAAHNIRVMNLSLGHPVGESYTTDPLCQAVEKAWKAGIVVVVAAGNAGRRQDVADLSLNNEGYGTAYGSIQSPGNSPYVITVGAMKSTGGNRANDRIATYSSRGPSRLDLVLKPDIVAPGNRVIAPVANHSYLDTTYATTNVVKKSEYCYTSSTSDSAQYFRLSGTSMAAPVVAGAAALMLQANPNLSPDTIKARLMLSADKWGGDACTYGAGYLNLPAALRSTVVARGHALSPSLYRDSLGNVYVNKNGIIWGEGVIWGTGIDNLQVIWGNGVIWGENTLSGSGVIWGESVWADGVIWGESTGAVDLSSTAINGEN